MIEPNAEVIAVAAAVLAAVFFGIDGVVGKRGIEAGGDAILASLVVAAVSMLVFGAIATVTSAPFSVLIREPTGTALFFLSGVLSSGFGVILIYEGIGRVGASVNSAVLHSRPLYAVIFGLLLLGESVSSVTLIGIVIVVGGLLTVSTSRGGDIRGWTPRDVLVPLGAAGFVALGNVVRRYALTRTEVPLIEGIAVNALGGLVVIAGYVLVRGQNERLRAPGAAYAWFVGAGVVVAIALWCLFFALERERVAIVEAIVSTAPLFTLLLSVVLLRDVERVTGRLLAGTALIVIGATLIVAI